MLGTVLPLVKFRVEVLGMAFPSPFQAVKNPEPVVPVAVMLTANAVM